jgi:hypothetical protein
MGHAERQPVGVDRQQNKPAGPSPINKSMCNAPQPDLNPNEAASGSSIVRLGPWTRQSADGVSRIESRFEVSDPGGTHTGILWISSRTHRLAPSGDTLLAASFFPALMRRADLEIGETISPSLLHNSRLLREVFGCWLERPEPWAIRAPMAAHHPAESRRVATFFSGGVDSFYTALRHAGEVSALIFVRGFDFAVTDRALGDEVSRHLQAIAAELRMELVEVETNARDLVVALGCDWGLSHAAAMVAVGHALADQFHRICVPSTHTYKDLFPWGSNPFTDPLWSSEGLEFVHDGAETSRVGKVAFLAGHAVAMNHLRVCWENRGGAYNCGRCEKCLRTKVNLRAVGMIDGCRTLPGGLDLKQVARMVIRDLNGMSFVRENYEYVRKRGNDPALERALRYCLEQRFNRGIWRWLRKAWGKVRYGWLN